MRILAIAGQLVTVAANHSLFALTRLCSKTPNFLNGTHLSGACAFLSMGNHFLHSKLLYLFPLKGHVKSHSTTYCTKILLYKKQLPTILRKSAPFSTD